MIISLFKKPSKIMVILLIMMTLSNIVAGQQEQIVFMMDDPVGDDNGPGTYVYPTNPVFDQGVFDLVGFEVTYSNGKVFFKTYFKNLGGNPWNGPNGFSLQYIHIYVLTKGNYPNRRDTIGLNVLVNPGWHFALLLSGGWNPGPLPEGEYSTIYYYDYRRIVQSDSFKVYANQSENAVIAEVDQFLLPDIDHIGEWGYAVMIASYDGYSPDGTRVRPVNVTPANWTFGGADALAVQNNVAPRVIDVLAPTKDDQYSMLGSYNASGRRLAIVNIVFPSQPSTINIVTSTPQTTKHQPSLLRDHRGSQLRPRLLC